MGLLDGNIGEFDAEANSNPNSLPSGDRAKIQVLRGNSSAADIAKNLAWGEFALGKGTDGYDLWIGGKNDGVNDAQKVVLAHEFDTKIKAIKDDIIGNIGAELDAAIKYDGTTVTIGGGDIDGNTVDQVDIVPNTTIKGNATVDGTSTLKGVTTIGTDATEANLNLTVKGKASVTGDITAGGKLTSDSLEVTNLTKSGSLEVTGDSTLNGKVTANGGLQVNGTSDISGKTTIGAGLDVTGGTKSDSLNVTGESTLGGKVTANDGLEVNGKVTNAKAGLNVTGGTTSDSLNVTGDTSLSNVTISGALTIETTGGITQIDPTTVSSSDNYLELNVTRKDDGTIDRSVGRTEKGGLVVHGKSDNDFALRYDSTTSDAEKLDFLFKATQDSDGNVDSGSPLLSITNSAVAGDARMEFAGHIHAGSFSGDVDGGEF